MWSIDRRLNLIATGLPPLADVGIPMIFPTFPATDPVGTGHFDRGRAL
jgi:hypothetical protein